MCRHADRDCTVQKPPFQTIVIAADMPFDTPLSLLCSQVVTAFMGSLGVLGKYSASEEVVGLGDGNTVTVLVSPLPASYGSNVGTV